MFMANSALTGNGFARGGTLIRACLQYCADVGEAVEMFRKNKIMFGGYTVNCMDTCGKNAVIEVTLDDMDVSHAGFKSLEAMNHKAVLMIQYETL